jgi:hypothetical protein
VLRYLARSAVCRFDAVFLLAFIFAAVLATQATAGGPFVFREERDYITLFEGDTPVFRYVRGEILPNGAPEDRRRSTYVHPLYSLDGRQLSEDGPRDHWHHRGMSWMWPKVTFDGITKDLWTLKGIRQHYEKHESQVYADRAVLTVANYWEEDSTKRRILDETVTFIAYKADTAGRIIDFELRLSAKDVPVALGTSARGYGGLQIRFGPREDTIITTSKGKIDKDTDRLRLTWADLSARFNGSSEFDGVAIFDNKQNLHFPSGWTLRPYGVLNPAFTSTSTDYTIEPEKPLTLRYRIYIHRGKADAERLNRMFDCYYRRG